LLGALTPLSFCLGGGLSGILHKSRLFPPLCLGGGPGPAKLCVCVCALRARFARVPPRLARIPPLPPLVWDASRRTLTRPYPPAPALPPSAWGGLPEDAGGALVCVLFMPSGGGEKPYRRAPTYLKGGRGGALPPLCLGPARGCWRRTFARIMSCDARLAPPT
jgi:hypothetical protein